MKEKINFKAIIIEASAGTGKTQWITEEFIHFIGKEDPASDMRRILAVTFSEKAAIEMKSRILEKIYEGFFKELSDDKKIEAENAMLKLRISTIHSFCRLLLKRFAFYRGIDPFFGVIDERQSDLLSYMAFNSFLSSENSKDVLPLLKDFKMDVLKKLLFSVMKTHPYATIGSPEGILSSKINFFSRQVAAIHSRIKSELSMLDFNDLEVMTYEILTESPDALTILEDFDEKNNFIFVDEFQDTNLLQWRIIYELVREWLSGYGAKAEKEEQYGIFLVGDRKQSIYKFRGAEGKVFDEAKEILNDYCTEKKLLKNYRSSGTIIDFVNNVFEDIYPWREEKLTPGLKVEMPSCIEINFIEGRDNKDAKKEEYQWVLRKIQGLINSGKPVWDKKIGAFRPIDFCDIAILLRKKAGKNFPLLEKYLKEAGIPFVVLGGMGFYKEPEILFLLSLIFALTDPTDGVSLWNLYISVYRITPDKIYRWRDTLQDEEIVDVIEMILKELNFWDGLSTQQKANVEKFLMILDEWKGTPAYTISRNLRTMMLSDEEPKADIFSEHQNAVRVLTVHNAKGLEFPAVFLINVEDGRVILKDNILYRKTEEGEPPYKFILKRETNRDYEESFRNMLKEEELRVLYVALTRACQYLFITGVKQGSSIWMALLERFQSVFPQTPLNEVSGVEQVINIDKTEGKDYLTEKIDSTDILTSYTEEKERGEYHYEGTILGSIAHKLMYEISEGRIKDKEGYRRRVDFHLKKSDFGKNSRMRNMLMKIYENIEKNPEMKKIISNQRKNRTFSEFSFISEIKGKVYTGFIDRLIITEDNKCYIYDYKIEKGDLKIFREQMEIYERAVRSIFPDIEVVRRFIIFLGEGVIKEI
ncbi:MAG TPA: UvrD-helicase domain-containing protein [bacterium]|nr:UvrD-helicase domain-containing protein [bacterium]